MDSKADYWGAIAAVVVVVIVFILASEVSGNGEIDAGPATAHEVSGVWGVGVMEETKTVVILIGNTDNKLPQSQWSSFVHHVRNQMEWHSLTVHFSGGSDYDAPWQNACFVVQVATENVPHLKRAMRDCANTFSQDSIAMVIGETVFVGGENGQ